MHARSFRANLSHNLHTGNFVRGPIVSRPMKSLHVLLLTLFFSMLGACASKPKSGARMYEGDTSPQIRMYEENPGGPLGR